MTTRARRLRGVIRTSGCLIGILAAVAVVAGLVWVAGSEHTDRLEYFRIVDPDTIAVGTVTGQAAWTRVTEVSESSSQIRITVKTWVAPVNRLGIGYPIEFTVDLRQPLGNRVVLDGFDRVVPLDPSQTRLLR